MHGQGWPYWYQASLLVNLFSVNVPWAISWKNRTQCLFKRDGINDGWILDSEGQYKTRDTKGFSLLFVSLEILNVHVWMELGCSDVMFSSGVKVWHAGPGACQLKAQCLHTFIYQGLPVTQQPQVTEKQWMALCRCSISLVTECTIPFDYMYEYWITGGKKKVGVVFKLLKIVKLIFVMPLYQEIFKKVPKLREGAYLCSCEQRNVQMIINKDIGLNSFTIKGLWCLFGTVADSV